jgi:hypothetical protein
VPAASDIIGQRSQPRRRGDPPGAALKALGDDDGFHASVPVWSKGSRNSVGDESQSATRGVTVTSHSKLTCGLLTYAPQGCGVCAVIGQPRVCPCRVSTTAGRLSSFRHSARELLELLSPINFMFHSVLLLHFQRIKRFAQYISAIAPKWTWCPLPRNSLPLRDSGGYDRLP